MRHYEVVFIVHPDQSEQVPAMVERYRTTITGKNGRIHRLEDWGRRQLAYSIGSKENGYYVVSRFSAEPQVLPEYERALKLDEGVIRYLITLYEHEVGAPAMSDEEIAIQAARRAQDDDDDDED